MNKIIEREGRYFVQFPDGSELERTLEQLKSAAEQHKAAIQASVERHANTAHYLNTWLEMHGGNAWGIAQVPKDADNLVLLKVYFEAIEKHFHDDFQKGEDTGNAVRMCDYSISLLKSEKANPYCNKALIGYQIKSWKQIKSRLQLLPTITVPSPTVASTPPSPPSALDTFAPLLRNNYTLADLTALLTELGLLDTTGRPTPAASPGTWVGVIYGLREAKPARLGGSKSAAHKAFCQTFKAVVSLSAVNTGLGKRDSESEKVRDRILSLLD